MADWFIDPISGGASSAGTSYATRRLNVSGLSINPGDRVKYIKSGDPQALSGVDGTFTNGSDTLTLSDSTVCKLITDCQTAWTGSANVTCTTSSTRREGTLSASMAFAAGFTTGLAAYFDLGGAQDFSGYEKITFWLRTTSIMAADTLQLSLCSDAVGATPVNSITVDVATLGSNWVPITIDTGGALGASIQSIALYCLLDPGTNTVLLDDILAANDLTLNTLVGKNTSTETFWALKSINGATAKFDNSPASSATVRGYWGVSETVPLYIRNTLTPTLTTGNIQNTSSSGSAGSPILISGGWDTTDMSTQTGETWIDGRSGQGVGFMVQGQYISFEKMAFTRCSYGLDVEAAQCGGLLVASNNNTNDGIYMGIGSTQSLAASSLSGNNYGFEFQASAAAILGDITNCHSNTSYPLYGVNRTTTPFSVGDINASNNTNGITLTAIAVKSIGNVSAHSNASSGIDITSTSSRCDVLSISASSNTTFGARIGSPGETHIYDMTLSGNTSGNLGLSPMTSGGGQIYLKNAKFSGTLISNQPAGQNQRVYSQFEQNNITVNKTYTDGALVSSSTTNTHGTSTLSWKIDITSTNRGAGYPYRFLVATIGFNAGSEVTFSAWVERTSSNIFANLVLPAGRVAGVTNGVTTSISGTTYDEYTITFTPTQAGAEDIYLDVWTVSSTTDSVYIDDLSLSQA